MISKSKCPKENSRSVTAFICSLETKLYSERHTKVVLDRERQAVAKKVADVRNHN